MKGEGTLHKSKVKAVEHMLSLVSEQLNSFDNLMKGFKTQGATEKGRAD